MTRLDGFGRCQIGEEVVSFDWCGQKFMLKSQSKVLSFRILRLLIGFVQHHGGLSHKISFSSDGFLTIKRFAVVSEGFNLKCSISEVDLFVIHSPEAIISILAKACNMDVLIHRFDHVLRGLPVAGPVQCCP